ncbi:unnamed protein product [Phaeothamnion confervicola]
MTSVVFMIVGRAEPLYEAELGGGGSSAAQKPEESSHLNQFIIHSALDMVDRKQWAVQSTYLKTVDKFNDQLVSAMLTPSGVKLMLLHDGRSEEAIRTYFNEVHELYVKLLLNPFYKYDTPIVSPAFDQRVRALAKRLL